MGAIEIIVIIASVLFVGGVCLWSIIRKKQGKGGCCNCSACKYSSTCSSKQNEENEQ